MGRYQHHRDRRPAATERTPALSKTEYWEPTVRLEDQVFTIGSTKDAAKFELVKEKLSNHFATQSWIDGAYAVTAIETLTEPM